LKKRKKGTTLKPPVKPCDKCRTVETCTFEHDWELFLNTRWSPSTRAYRPAACKKFFDWLKKLNKNADQDHVSQKELISYSERIDSDDIYSNVDDSYLLDQMIQQAPLCGPLCALSGETSRAYMKEDLMMVSTASEPGQTGHIWKQATENRYAYRGFEAPEYIDFPYLTLLENKILNLYYIDALSIREVVRSVNGGRRKLTAVNLTIDAVKSRLARIRKKLRHHSSKGRGDYQQKITYRS